MSLPIELKKILGDIDPDAHAQLNATFGSPIGETHFVVIQGELKAFTRESLIGELEAVELDPAHPPKLETGSFSDTLHVALKDGESYEFNVGSFERDNVKSVLEACGAPGKAPASASDQPEDSHADRFKEAEDYQHAHGGAPDTEPAAGESGSKFESDYAQRGKGYDTGGEQDYAVGRSEDYAAERSRGYGAERRTGYAAERSVGYNAEKRTGYSAEKSTGYSAEETRVYDSDGEEAQGEKIGGGEVFRSNDPGWFGCILQLVLFAGGVVGFWFLHVIAMQNAAAYFGWGELDPEGAAWVGTKIVALVCGAYVGGKLSGLVSKLAKSQMWGGAVLFKDELMVVFGPKSKWNKRIYLNQYLTWECRWYTGSSSDDKKDKRSYHVLVVVRQEGVEVGLKTTFFAKQVNLHVQNMEYTQLETLPNMEGAIAFDEKTFRNAIRKLAEIKGWQA